MFSVCVTKPLPLDDLMSIIRQFREQRLTFGLLEVKPAIFELWREPLPDENNTSKFKPYYRGVIHPQPPRPEQFKVVYIHGRQTEIVRNIPKKWPVKKRKMKSDKLMCAK